MRSRPWARQLRGGAKSDSAGLVDESLAAGRKDGYAYRYVIVGANTSGCAGQV